MSTEKKLIGHIGVDAGLCWIGDPCYVLPDDGSQRENVQDWDEFCNIMAGHQHVSFDYSMGHEGLGVCVSTGYGDGYYPVVAEIIDDPDWGRRIKSVTITFIKDDEEAST